jgi:hypothetical protein
VSARGDRVRQQWGADEAWAKIRSARSTRPGLTQGDDARTQTYLASVQQFEELYRTAASVGVASRPILLFYGLSQVGRALLAAREANQWQVHGHGLSFVPATSQGAIFDSGVKTHRQGLFQAVVSVLAEDPPTRAMTLAELWAAMPGLPRIAETSQEKPPLRVAYDVTSGGLSFVLYSSPSVLVGIPGATTVQEAAAAVDPYLRLPVRVETGWTSSGSDPDPDDILRSLTLEQPRSFRLVPEGGAVTSADLMRELGAKTSFGQSWLLPKVGDSNNIGILLLWWMLLYVFSILARYEPAAWVTALDVNDSPVAVPLEAAFDAAQRQIPPLVLRELPK